jgi:hypothetical protein
VRRDRLASTQGSRALERSAVQGRHHGRPGETPGRFPDRIQVSLAHLTDLRASAITTAIRTVTKFAARRPLAFSVVVVLAPLVGISLLDPGLSFALPPPHGPVPPHVLVPLSLTSLYGLYGWWLLRRDARHPASTLRAAG